MVFDQICFLTDVRISGYFRAENFCCYMSNCGNAGYFLPEKAGYCYCMVLLLVGLTQSNRNTSMKEMFFHPLELAQIPNIGANLATKLTQGRSQPDEN